MRSSGWARIGYVLADTDHHAPYYREVIEHAGFRAEVFSNVQDLTSYDVVFLFGNGEWSPYRQLIANWIADGGVLVVSGGDWGLNDLLGLRAPTKHVSNSVIEVVSPRLRVEAVQRIRFLGGVVGQGEADVEILAKSQSLTVASRRAHGKGFVFFLGCHIGQTIALMQMGRSVDCDAVGPEDDDLQLDDGKLRSEDGIALDFARDRSKVEECDTAFFAYACADAIKEVLVRLLLLAIESTELRTVLCWYWPNNAIGTAMLTMDCEDSEFDYAVRTHRMLTMFGCPACWVVPMPGYRADSYRLIRAWDHEVGVLFQTDDSAGWHPERFHIQFTAMSRLSSAHGIQTARPVDGRWRGYQTFYEIAQESGARISLSKGGRQAGTMGFAFGTCHPFFPVKRDGHSFFVMEIPHVAYMPGEDLKDPMSDAILTQTVARNGCFHIVSRPEAIINPVCSAALRRTLSLCKQQRLEFITPSEALSFEQARRRLRTQAKKIGDDLMLQVTSDAEVSGITLMITGDPVDAVMRGKDLTVSPENRFGVRFNVVQFDLPAKHTTEVTLQERTNQNVAA